MEYKNNMYGMLYGMYRVFFLKRISDSEPTHLHLSVHCKILWPFGKILIR